MNQALHEPTSTSGGAKKALGEPITILHEAKRTPLLLASSEAAPTIYGCEAKAKVCLSSEAKAKVPFSGASANEASAVLSEIKLASLKALESGAKLASNSESSTHVHLAEPTKRC